MFPYGFKSCLWNLKDLEETAQAVGNARTTSGTTHCRSTDISYLCTSYENLVLSDEMNILTAETIIPSANTHIGTGNRTVCVKKKWNDWRNEEGREMQRRSKGDGTEKGRRCKVCGIPQYILYDNDNDDDNYE